MAASRDAQSIFDQMISFCGNDVTEADVLDGVRPWWRRRRSANWPGRWRPATTRKSLGIRRGVRPEWP